MVKQIIFSSCITIAVGLLCSFALSNILGFWQAFAFSVALQFILSSLYNNFITNKSQLKHEELINERLDTLAKNVVTFACPCGKHVFNEVVYINIDNVFKCEGCKEDIRVEVTLTPVVKTYPINVDDTYNKLQTVV